ncbi:amino acid adenylation domain-containing protein [Bacillus idriensis]|uniref:Amino acid adenylation domain-containing protein n=1 Tax=Metabacillus idriensis TaxID=324768 RepID=A0A6I2MEK6_9BACI|nr:non-ribosomal peptide synthetase [Metabacillus idriensis]MRX56179.1 amino acid adenylation domain-containing protein [Metabacillus idriensis]
MSKLEFSFDSFKFDNHDLQADDTVSMKEIRDADIAVIGIDCKVAESQNSIEFWQHLRDGKDFIRPFPSKRKKDLLSLFESGFIREDVQLNEGGFLEEINTFDYNFFQISPAEARLMDPNQRIFLESAWTAIEDAGYGGEKLSGSRTGVYVGYSNDFSDEYKRLIAELAPSSISASIPGNIHSIIASRVAYLLNLKGPSMLIDTACSSSLVAVHLACRSLREGDCEYAIAGGMKITLLPVKQGKGGGLGVGSSDDRTRTFDNSSTGTGGGEGVVSVLLKPLKNAIKDNDHVYAIIKGSAVNNDGTTVGITAPNSLAGEDVIVRAWEDADIDPETISYIEAHGTGTKLGDPIEIDGIEKAFRQFTDRKQFCAIGSVKTNVGHLDNSAGIVGLLKAILALKNEEIPANLHFTNPNPEIQFIDSPVYVNDRLQNWETNGHPRRCGISSFGLSGTNCHMVLEEAPKMNEIQEELPEKFKKQLIPLTSDSNKESKPHNLFTISAKSVSVLSIYIKKYRNYFKKMNPHSLEDICFTAGTGRGHYNYRISVICENVFDLIEKLEKIHPDILDWENGLQELSSDHIYFGRHKVVSSHKQKEPGELSIEDLKELNGNAQTRVENIAFELETIKAISKLYVLGANISWFDMYKGRDFKKVSIPTYPFERIRCWVDFENDALVHHNNKALMKTQEGAHPLVDACLAETEDQEIYITRFSSERHWVLREHVIMGNPIIPGTTYLEIAREVLKKYQLPGTSLELKDIQFISPLMVNNGEEIEVQTVVQRNGKEFKFTILSKSNISQNPWEQNWVRHTKGQAVFVQNSNPSKINLEEIIKNCNSQEFLESEEQQEFIEAFDFGPRWKTLKKIHVGTDQVLAELELKEDHVNDLRQFVLHPALLDVAVGVASQSMGNGLFLPLTYKKIRIHNSLPGNFYSYIKKRNRAKESGEVLTVDIQIFDTDGSLLLEIEDYSVKRVHQAEMKFSKFTEEHKYHRVVWKAIESHSPSITSVLNEYTENKACAIVFSDESNLSKSTYEQLISKGYEVIEVKQGEAFAELGSNLFTSSNSEEDLVRIIDSQHKKIEHVIYLWSCKPERNREIDNYSDSKNLEQNIIGLFNLSKILGNKKITCDLTVIAKQAYEVTGEENTIYPENASIFGLVKVINQENVNISCYCIDVDDKTDSLQINHEIELKERRFLIALRENTRYIEQIERFDLAKKEDDTASIVLKNRGVYVITGGTGGLGLEVGKWIAKSNKVTLVLISQTEMPPKREWDYILDSGENKRLIKKIENIKMLESLGATVDSFACDISNELGMTKVFSEVRKKYKEINGVIHAAGIAGDGLIALKDQNSFTRVLSPKINGLNLIEKLTTNDSLDFLILFSSITSFIGGVGQSDYAAANAYLDSFSTLRNRKGKRTISINWAAWKETGMALDYDVNFDEALFKPLMNNEAKVAFENVLLNPQSNLIVGEIHYAYVANLENTLPMELSEDIKISLNKHRRFLNTNILDSSPKSIEIMGRPSGEYSNTEKIVGEIWAEVLGFNKINIFDDFYELGGDSLIASNIVSKINQKISDNSDISDIFNYLTIEELARNIDNGQRDNLENEESNNSQELTSFGSNSITPVKKSPFYPVSSAQRRFYMMRQVAGESTLNNLCSAMTIRGLVDKSRLERAIQLVISRHGSLRTAFEFQDNELVQRIYEDVPFELEYKNGDGSELSEYTEAFVRPFDLHHAPLIRAKLIKVSDELHFFLCDVDHIAVDGSSIGILMNEIISGYTGNNLPEIKAQYVDFTIWQNQRIRSKEMKNQEDYWLNVFHDNPTALDMPTDVPRAAQMSNEGDAFSFELSEELTALAKEAAAEHGVTLFMLLFSVYNIMLAKYAKRDDIVVGVPSAGRKLEEVQDTIGLFINTLALRTAPNQDKIFSDYLKEVKEHAIESYKHEEYPFEMLLNKLKLPIDRSRNPLFDVQFISQNFSNETVSAGELQFTPIEPKMEAVQVDLTAIWYEQYGKLKFHFEYSTQLFNRDTIKRLATYYENILSEVISDGARPIAKIPMITNEEKQQSVYSWNNTVVDFNKGKLIHELFEEQVERTPEKIAAVYNNQSLTYRSLNNKANQLARYMLHCNLEPEQIVGISVDRSLEMLIAMLAVLKTGAAYIPIDPSDPIDRISYFIKDSGLKLLLTDHKQEINLVNIPIINVTDEKVYIGDGSNLMLTLNPNSLAYIIYTSGTSGTPKGVMVEHTNVENYINAFKKEFVLTEDDVVLQQASYTFDASVEEIFPILTIGGKLIVVSRNNLLDINLLESVINEHQVTLISTSPLILNELNKFQTFPTVKTYISGGDVLREAYVTNLMNNSKVYNTYGPTEATVCCTYYQLSESNANPLPIGRPIANVAVYILDDDMNVMPINVPGEICISGKGVARGYLNNPDLTNSKFVLNPWKKESLMYRTGDIGKYLPDGNIQYLGRVDDQENIRGYRIEPAEIEVQLLKHENINDAIVINQEIHSGLKELCVYFVSEQNLSAYELTAYLSRTLPKYMIPTSFIKVDTLPLTSNGKVDRKSLINVGEKVETGLTFVKPTTPLEVRISDFWSQVLKKEKIGILDDFFLIGGQSLLATKLVYLINQEWALNMTLRDFFQAGTIKGLADIIEKSQFERKEQGDITEEGIVKPFNLRENPLFRIKLIHLPENRHLLFIDMHHIITDGISQGIIINEFANLYQEKELPQLQIQYKDYAVWQESYTKSEDYRIQERFWLNQFQGDIPKLNLPCDYPRPEVRRGEGKPCLFNLGSEWSAKLKRFSVEQDVTPFMVLLAVYKIALLKFSEKEDIIIGVPVSGRTNSSLNPVVGMFVNTVAIRTQPRKDMTAQDFIMVLKESILCAMDNQNYPFDKLVENLDLAGSHSQNPLFDTMFTLNNESLLSPIDIPGLKIIPHKEMEYGGAQFDLTLISTISKENIEFNFQYDISLFKEETVKRIGENYLFILQSILDDSSQLIRNVLLDEYVNIDGKLKNFTDETTAHWEEKEWNNKNKQLDKNFLVNGLSESEIEVDSPVFIHQLFENQVNLNPEKIAIVHGQKEITYTELNNKANQVAQTILNCGIKPEQTVGIVMERSLEMVISLLGTLKSGAAYLPINPLDPMERNQHILTDAGVKLILTHKMCHSAWMDEKMDLVIDVDVLCETQNECKNPNLELNPESLAYVIYTSGSTGAPKGVMVEHKAFTSRMIWFSKKLDLKDSDTGLQKASYNFDGSMIELFSWFISGGRLVLLEKGAETNIGKIIATIEEQKVTYSFFIPTILKIFISSLSNKDRERISSLRVVVSGGEALPKRLVDSFNENLPGVLLLNFYGPTEATIFATTYTCSSVTENIIPIGKPVGNTRTYILDDKHEIAPIGIEGELYIGGPNLARGYLNLDELTAESFIPNPFIPGERIYRTGDLAILLANGEISYLGRKDEQIKIRGYRIEIGEIESTIMKFPKIDQVAVLINKDKEDTKYLTAYLVTSSPTTVKELRNYLKEQLPDYMIPLIFKRLDSMPLNSNGKLDRKKIKEQGTDLPSGLTISLPRNEIEKKLTAIWEDVLQTSSIGIDDHFFELGGDSLLANQLAYHIYREFYIDLSLADLFKTPTVRALAERINHKNQFDEVAASFENSPNTLVSINEKGLFSNEYISNKGYYPAAPSQKRLFIIHELNNEDLSYNLPGIILLEGNLEYTKLEKIFRKLTERHEAFRTSFDVVEGEIVQRIHDSAPITIETFNTEESDIKKILEGEAKLVREQPLTNNYALSSVKVEKKIRRRKEF